MRALTTTVLAEISLDRGDVMKIPGYFRRIRFGVEDTFLRADRAYRRSSSRTAGEGSR